MTVIFTSGFETENNDFNVEWTGKSGNPIVASNQVYRGLKSAEFDALEYCYKTLPISQAIIYHRFYVRLTELPDVNSEGVAIALGYAGGTAIFQVAIYQMSGNKYWTFNYRNGVAWTFVYNLPSTINPNTWYCVEIYWKLGAVDGEVYLWVDGVEIANVTGKDTNDYGNCDTIRNGITYLNIGGEAITVYIDCVVVADVYIGLEAEVGLGRNPQTLVLTL